MTCQEEIIIHAKDIANICGCSYVTGTRMLKKVKKALGKQPHQLVTYEEFYAYYGIKSIKP